MKGEWGGGRGLAALSSSPIAPLMHIGFRQGIVAPYTQAALDLGDPAVGYRRARLSSLVRWVHLRNRIGMSSAVGSSSALRSIPPDSRSRRHRSIRHALGDAAQGQAERALQSLAEAQLARDDRDRLVGEQVEVPGDHAQVHLVEAEVGED